MKLLNDCVMIFKKVWFECSIVTEKKGGLLILLSLSLCYQIHKLKSRMEWNGSYSDSILLPYLTFNPHLNYSKTQVTGVQLQQETKWLIFLSVFAFYCFWFYFLNTMECEWTQSKLRDCWHDTSNTEQNNK